MVGTSSKDEGNGEGVAPSPPLAWNCRADLKDVVLYGNLNSNATMKVRSFLIYHKVPFTHDLSPPPVKALKGGYDKVPILIAGGRRINDSFYIIEGLCQALGCDFDAAWEEKITYTLHPAFFSALPGEEAFAALTHPKTGVVSLPSWCGSCLGGQAQKLLRSFADKTRKNVGPPRCPTPMTPPDRVCASVCEDFRAALGSKTFQGGDKPSHVDLGLYGFFCHYYIHGSNFVIETIDSAQLKPWFQAMTKEVPPDVLVSARTDFTKPAP